MRATSTRSRRAKTTSSTPRAATDRSSSSPAPRAGDALPWSDWALLPVALEFLLAEVESGRRRVIECGSGVSTIALARALRDVGGRLHALEHDAGWAASVVAWLEREGLGATATVIDAPLRPHPHALDGGRWYDETAVARLPAAAADLLLVDGPPAGEQGLERSRYPALGVLGERLADDAIVVLDDVNRPGETDILAAWERETEFRFVRRPGERIAIGRREPPAGAAARGSVMGQSA